MVGVRACVGELAPAVAAAEAALAAHVLGAPVLPLLRCRPRTQPSHRARYGALALRREDSARYGAAAPGGRHLTTIKRFEHRGARVHGRARSAVHRDDPVAALGVDDGAATPLRRARTQVPHARANAKLVVGPRADGATAASLAAVRLTLVPLDLLALGPHFLVGVAIGVGVVLELGEVFACEQRGDALVRAEQRLGLWEAHRLLLLSHSLEDRVGLAELPPLPDLRSLEPLGRELPKVDLRRLALLSPFVVLDGGQLVQPKVVVEQRASKGVAEPPPLRVVHIARVVLVLLPDVVLALLLTSLPLTFRRHSSATLATGQRRRRSRLIRLALARGQDDAIRGIVGRTARLLSRVVAGRVGRSGKAAHRLDLIFEGLEREVVEDTSGRLPNRLGARATLVLHEVHLLRDGATLQVDGRAGLAKDAVDDGRVGVEHLAQARVLAPAYAQVVARAPIRVDVGQLRLIGLGPVALGHGSGHELERGLDGGAAPT